MKYIIGFILAILLTLFTFSSDVICAILQFLWDGTLIKREDTAFAPHKIFWGEIQSVVSLHKILRISYGVNSVFCIYKTYYHYIWGIK